MRVYGSNERSMCKTDYHHLPLLLRGSTSICQTSSLEDVANRHLRLEVLAEETEGVVETPLIRDSPLRAWGFSFEGVR